MIIFGRHAQRMPVLCAVAADRAAAEAGRVFRRAAGRGTAGGAAKNGQGGAAGRAGAGRGSRRGGGVGKEWGRSGEGVGKEWGRSGEGVGKEWGRRTARSARHCSKRSTCLGSFLRNISRTDSSIPSCILKILRESARLVTLRYISVGFSSGACGGRYSSPVSLLHDCVV